MVLPYAHEAHEAEPERQAVAALYATGHWLLSVDCPRAALDVFRTMLLVAPGDERAWLGLGRAHEELDGTETAGRLYALARRAVPASCRCHLAHARVLARLERHDDARAALDAAQQIADKCSDEELAGLVETERGRLS
jgi:hypothetical protein